NWLDANLGWILMLAGFLALLGFVMFIIGIAARGALIHEIDQVDTGERVSLRRGWRAGFSHWWRVLGISIITGLPVLVVTIMFLIAIVMLAFSVFASVPSTTDGSGSGVVIALLGTAGFLLLAFIFVIVVLGFIVGIWTKLSTAAGVL